MKVKLINALLILTSLGAYLEWGGGNNMFLWQGERDILRKLFSNSEAVLHPLTLIPLLGQLLLLVTFFQKRPSKALTYTGIACMSLLLLFIFFIGIFGRNLRMAVSVLPFIITTVCIILHYRKARKKILSTA